MTVSDAIAALALPPDSRIDKRVAKKLLVENGAPTAADKRQINGGIEELTWLAALKPNNIGIPQYRDEVREVVEIAVLSLSLRADAKASRLVELIHRAIPYPVLLVSEQGEDIMLSVANKRFAQNEVGKVVLDDAVTSCMLEDRPELPVLLAHLALTSQPRTHLFALYQGWLACMEGFQAARLTGKFNLPVAPEAVAARRAALAEHARVSREITLLRAQAEKELQIHRLVELNLEIKRLEALLAEAVTIMRN